MVEATDTNLLRNRYEPSTVQAMPGQGVTVRNTGSDRHTLTSSVPGEWTEVDLGPGQTGGFVAPQELGEHRFYCRYHASAAATPDEGMAGILQVVQTLAPGPPPPSSPPPALPPPPGNGTGNPTPLGPEAALLALVAAAVVGRRWGRREPQPL